MRYFSTNSIIASVIIFYLLEVIVVSSSKPVGEDYLNLVLRYEKLEVIKVYPLYQDDASMLTLIRNGEGIANTMKHLTVLFYFGLLTGANNSIESWKFTTPGGNVSYLPKAFMGINSQMPSLSYQCSPIYDNQTGSNIFEGWASLGGYYPFLYKEYYSEKWVDMNKSNLSADIRMNLTTPEGAWTYYTNMIEDEKAWGFYTANLLKGYTFGKDLRAVYYYGSEGKLIVSTQFFSDEELRGADLFVDGEKKNFEVESSMLIADVGSLESGRHYVEISSGNLSKRLDFYVEWMGMYQFRLDINGTLYLEFINRRNESVVLKKFIANDATINVEEQLPALGDGLVYYNETGLFLPPRYNVSLQVPVGNESVGDCKYFNLVVEYSLPDGSVARDEWENYGMKFEGH